MRRLVGVLRGVPQPVPKGSGPIRDEMTALEKAVRQMDGHLRETRKEMIAHLRGLEPEPEVTPAVRKEILRKSMRLRMPMHIPGIGPTADDALRHAMKLTAEVRKARSK